MVGAFEVLADPVRRRILELLAAGEVASGELASVLRAEFGVSQPAVSQHLKVLRENGFAGVRAEGTRRLYSIDSAPLQEVDAWLTRFRPSFQSLDALATEVARGRSAHGRSARGRRPRASADEEKRIS